MSDGTWNWHSIVIAIGAPLIVAGYTRALSFQHALRSTLGRATTCHPSRAASQRQRKAPGSFGGKDVRSGGLFV